MNVKTEVPATLLSQEWFEMLKDAVTERTAEFRRLGFVDTRFVIRVTDPSREIGLAFDTYECEQVVSLDTPEARESFDPDFVLEAPESVWREMIENIRKSGKADLFHTLNTLVLSGIVQLSSSDQLREDLFYRYNGSLQLFFDLAAEAPVPVAA